MEIECIANKYKHIILGGFLDAAEGVIFKNWKLGEFKIIENSIFTDDIGWDVDV